MIRRSLLLVPAGVLALLSSLPAAVPAGWFEVPSPEPVKGSALDLGGLNEKPAGAKGMISIKDGHFVTPDGQRLRFWGTNLSSGENFPDAATAERLARRLALGGVNIVRLHHVDNPWSIASRGSIWSPDTATRIKVDAEQLDRLFRLVAALKSQGIYSNVNLKVSRTHTPADGFPESIALCPPFQKRVDYFNRRIIELQKDYARQLLATKNPYTGLTLAEDPAVAVVEINNENSLLGLRTRDVGRGLEQLPEPFKGELAALWNAWLLRQYPSREALAAAWRKGATEPGESPLSDASRWHPDAQPGNEVQVSASDDRSRLHLQVKTSDGIRWRAAAYLDQLKLRDGATYTLGFSARAERPRPLMLAVGRDDPKWRTDKWRTRGLHTTIELGTDWTPFRFVFTTHSVVDLPSRLSFLAGHQLGEIWIKDLRLESGSASAGLQTGQSAAVGTVPIPTDPTPAQWNDWLSFLVDTEKSTVAEMRAVLRDELKVRVPIVCSQANYGGIAGLIREQPSDFIDAHYYWQHPDFGGAGTWNLAHWTIINTPQLAEFSSRWFGEIGALALLRVAGKPFCVSEVDHPAPHEYACEMVPVLSSFAALQDWDALYPFDSVETGSEPDSGAIRTFFDQSHHPAKWGFAAFAARAFRLGLVPPASGTRELFVREPVWDEANHVDVLWLRQQPGEALGFLDDRLSVHDKLLQGTARTHITRQPGKQKNAVGMIKARHGSVYVVDAPQASSLVGYLGDSALSNSTLGITCDSFGLNFAALTAVSLDGRELACSQRTLVTLAARAENQGMVWNAERTSVGDRWGKGPAIAEKVPASIRVLSTSPRKVFALAPDGTRLEEVPSELKNGWLSFSTRKGPSTLHYELVAD